eukprot:237062_1
MSTVGNCAVIKKEYLVKAIDHQSNDNDDYLEFQTDSNSNNLIASEPPRKKQKKNERGQNKSRAKRNKIRYDIILCPDIGRGKACKFGDKCKYKHDIQNYLKCDKPKDIGPRCIFFEALSECPQGYLCRFANHHIDQNTFELIKKQPNEEHKQNSDNNNHYKMSKDLNIVSSKSAKFLNRLKANNLAPFPITKQIMKCYKQFNDKYHPTKRLKMYDRAKNNNILEEYEKWDTTCSITEDKTVENPFVFKDRKATDMKLLNTYKAEDRNIPNYYTSLDLIDLEAKALDIKNKLYLAPLTTVGNLPFRRICVSYGAEITCSEMALCTNLLKGQRGELALLRRHESEKLFGIQIAGGFVDSACKIMEHLHHSRDFADFKYDFIDLNVGCPLEELNNKRCGAALMRIPYHLRTILRGMNAVTGANLTAYSKGSVPITCKMRTGFMHNEPNAKEIMHVLQHDGVSAIGLHARSRHQRYRRPANWQYIKQCVDSLDAAADIKPRAAIIGNGDIYNWNEWYQYLQYTKCDTLMIGRGALIKPWIFTEIKERKHIDIASSERLEIVKRFVNYGLERWGSDQRGVDLTRRFALEWLSFLCRYIPFGILEKPANINQGVASAMYYIGRNELETLLASRNVQDWIKITEMFLGPVNDSNFVFIPKHKANAYAPSVVDDKNYILNDLGEVIKINQSEKKHDKEHCVLTTNVLGKKRTLNQI